MLPPPGIESHGTKSHAPVYMAALALLLVALTGTGSVQAMWAKMTDAELVERSPLIVMATYIGKAEAGLKVNGEILHPGVLQVDRTLKGNQREVIFLQLPQSESLIRKSDDIFFHPGQKGLWFLREVSPQKGIYKIDNPQRFVPEDKVDDRMDSLRKLLVK